MIRSSAINKTIGKIQSKWIPILKTHVYIEYHWNIGKWNIYWENELVIKFFETINDVSYKNSILAYINQDLNLRIHSTFTWKSFLHHKSQICNRTIYTFKKK